MTTFVIVNMPHPYYQSRSIAVGSEPMSFIWLALALTLAMVGFSLANLMISQGLATVVVAYNLALPPAIVGLGIAVVMFYREVLWSVRI
jgi:hypothetical protein